MIPRGPYLTQDVEWTESKEWERTLSLFFPDAVKPAESGGVTGMLLDSARTSRRRGAPAPALLPSQRVAAWLRPSTSASSTLAGARECTFKVSLVGDLGSGKTAVACAITGRPVPTEHAETLGAQALDVVWPFKVQRGALHAVRLDVWDCGSAALQRYAYLGAGVYEGAHAMLYVCSATDARSLAFVERSLEAHLAAEESGLRVASAGAASSEGGGGGEAPDMASIPKHRRVQRLVVLTHNDVWERREVHESNLEALRDRFSVDYVKLAALAGGAAPFFARPDVRRLLDTLALHLVRTLPPGGSGSNGVV
jgi:hypothetical protein